MSQASDRIAGILLGNAVIYLIFTQIRPKSAMQTVREKLATALGGLTDHAAGTRQTRHAQVEDIAVAQAELAEGANILETVTFEPRRLRPAPDVVHRTGCLIGEARGLATSLYLADGDTGGMAERLRALAARVGADALLPATDTPAAEYPSPADPADIVSRLDRIERIERA